VLLALGLMYATASCMRVEVSYRDVGGPDAWQPDAARVDASVDAPGMDAPRIDANDRDAVTTDTPSMDAPLPSGAEATRAVLAAIGEHVILARLTELEASAERLVTATDAARLTDTPANREAAREAWRAVMRTWQYLEVVQVGPAGLPLYALGGRGLRDEIHAWPFVSPCRVDQDLVDGAYATPELLRSEPVTGRGLPAIEYLLFVTDGANRCPATATINTSGTWAALGDAEVSRRRLIYAHSAAVLVAERARELRLAWDPAGENFLGTFSTAGAGSTLFTSAQAALNGLSDALFYIYKDVTDLKIGIPAGIYVDCATDTCPDNVESPWSDTSLDWIRINLLAFRDVYLGAPPPREAPGFGDPLPPVGAAGPDRRIREAIDVALAAVDPVEVPLETAVGSDAIDVAELHRATRALADLFRIEVITLLDLELPNRIEGDND